MGAVRKLVRSVVALLALLEAFGFFLGTALHLGIPMPAPFVETHYLPSAVLETASGVLLVIAALAALGRDRRAWKLAVAAHVAGVASIAFGIAVGGGGQATQSSHHPTMLLVLIVALIALSTPPFRHALEHGRRHSRRRRRILQAL
jgi:drug/metabolite transporter (DMT)-like permease